MAEAYNFDGDWRRQYLIEVGKGIWPGMTREEIEEKLIHLELIKRIEPMFKTLEHEGPNLP